MKTNWTKILVVLLTLTMILSLAACGPKDPPAESTPEQTTPQATPEASTPEASTPEASTPEASTPEASTPEASTPEASTPEASTPEASTPEDTETGKEPGKESTPAVTSPTEGRPTEPTIETGTTEKGNWIFEIDKSTSALKVDGLVDPAYYKGVYLVAEINLPADSESKFDLFIAADDTHIYVIYEFTKAEEIFYDATYEKLYHLDCVDFVLSLAGAEALGGEFRILGGVEGGKDKAVVDTDLEAKGVDNWYVKHTANGYNVEFSIPLEEVRGTDKNGDKMISFTALSTITTAWEDRKAQPTRSYTVACKAAGAEDKANPTLLVVKGTKTDDGIEKTEDGRYKYTLNAATEALAQDGVKDAAYEKGLQFKGKYYSNSAIASEYRKSETNDYVMYIAADADYIWVFVEVKDDNINTECPNYWHNDCVELFYNKAGNAKWNEEGYGSSLRVWAEGEGTDLIGKTPAEGEEYPFKSHVIGDAAGAITNHKPFLNSYTLKFVEGGYNVELTLKRSELKDKNIFSFLGVVTMAKDTANRTYVYTDNANGLGDNPDKDMLNQVVIVDAEKPVEGPAKTEDGRYTYTLNATKAALTVDGAMDSAYVGGLKFEAIYDTPASLADDNATKAFFKDPAKNTFTVYLAADANYVYVFYVVKDEFVVGADKASAWYRADCIDFILSTAAKDTEGTGVDMRIFGNIEGGKGTADARGVFEAITDYYVKTTTDGYNVEFKIDRAKFTDKNVFSFLAMGGACAVETEKATVYPCIENAAEVGGNPAKAKLNEVKIVDTPATTADGRYTFTLNAAKEALAVDGVMDAAYATGLKFEAIYDTPASLADDNATKAFFKDPAKNTFTVYLAADANYVYVFYTVKDEFVVGADKASAWYRADCIDFILSTAAKDTEGTGVDMRIFGNIEGGKGTADARGVFEAITDYYVKTTDEGYNVEFKIDRAKFTDKNVFSFLAMGGACAVETEKATVYPCIDNAANVGGNPAKAKLNEVKIVDAE